MAAKVTDANNSHFPEDSRDCSLCNSFQGIGPILSEADHLSRARELLENDSIRWSRGFRNNGVTWSDLIVSASSCYCCSVLLRGIEGCLRQHDIQSSQVWKLNLKFLYAAFDDDLKDCDKHVTCELANGKEFVVQFFTLEDEDCPCPDAWEGIPMSARTSSGTDSEEAMEKAREWLDDCISGSHEHCPAPIASALPTRVVDVGRQDGVIRLVSSDGKVDNYIALSHCWGKQQIITTTKATLEDRRREIHAHELSRTFMDAVLMTRRLGFDYIWIDSLCIIQDDSLDWQRESVKMASIYKEAYLTLSATRSSSGAGGLFTPTPDMEVSGITSEGEEYCLFFREKIEHDLSLGPDGAAYFPLLTRAWVCQERLLSPRLLHFGHHELFYECLENESCECGEIGFLGVSENIPLPSVKLMYPLNSDATLSGKANFWDEDGRYYLSRIWRSIVEQYTGLHLTVMSDRLPALSGVARDISDKKSCTYLAGLWESSLLDDLVWVTYNCKKPRPEEWRAPTWSWASVESQIHYNDAFVYWDSGIWQEELEKREILIEMHGCDTSVAGLDEFGQVKAGIIHLSGPAISGVLQRCDGHKDRQYSLHFKGKPDVPFWPDYALSESGPYQVPPASEVLCLRVKQDLKSKRDISLVLRSCPSQPKLFERIGLLLIYADRDPAVTAKELFAGAEIRTVDVV